jgi:hypothetical protein
MSSGKRRPAGTVLSDNNIKANPSGQPLPDGMYVARVLRNDDSTYTGRVEVEIADYNSNAPFSALLMTPMGGATDARDTSKNVEDEETTVKTFGMWTQPPAVGSTVMVQFSASLRQPVLIGGLITAPTNHNLGGNASAENYEGGITPVGEQNPNETGDPQTKPEETSRTENLQDQGLDDDHVRGHSMSSARRESPSKVMGITTPGGNVLTMDDGSADGSGSQNIRIRTAGGGQVLIDDSTGIIFITNQGGSTHIEMNAEGNIDIYSENSFSIGTEQDFNLHAKGAINMHAEQGINIKTDADYKLEAAGDTNISSTNHKETTRGRVYMNTGGAAAEKPEAGGLPENSGTTTSVTGRVPERHPWKGVPGVQEQFTTGEGKQR